METRHGSMPPDSEQLDHSLLQPRKRTGGDEEAFFSGRTGEKIEVQLTHATAPALRYAVWHYMNSKQRRAAAAAAAVSTLLESVANRGARLALVSIPTAISVMLEATLISEDCARPVP